MTLNTRLQQLESAAAKMPTAPIEEEMLTREHIMALSPQELQRRIQIEIKRPCPPRTPEQEREWKQEVARLAALPKDELNRLHREALGDLADTPRRWPSER